MVFNTNYRLTQVKSIAECSKGSILQYLWPSLSYHLTLTSWLSFVVSDCEFVTFLLVSWVRCGTWLYRFLIFAPLLTLSYFEWPFYAGVSVNIFVIDAVSLFIVWCCSHWVWGPVLGHFSRLSVVLGVLYSLAIILSRKRDLVALT